MPGPKRSLRCERVAEQIRMDAARILQRQLKDPRLGLVTCTRVTVTKDLRHAKIYVSVLGEPEEQQQTMKALDRATSFVRRELARSLDLRVSPEIRFLFDPAVEYSIRLEKLLEDANPAEEEIGPALERDAGEPEP